ncbi:MAG: long-chain fatty acid--CoA ligase [Cyclobacteriaceae bacterium]
MQPTRAFDFIFYQQENYPQNDCLNYKVNGIWRNYATNEVIAIVNNVSLGLLKLGVKPGDKVAIVSPNRPEWNFIDLAVQQIGAISVPMYPTITVEDYKYIFEHAEVKLVFAGTEELVRKVKEAIESLDISDVYSFDEIKGVDHWTKVRDMNRTEDVEVLDEYRNNINENDLLTIIYTSGTTGRPKGVMLSHKNIVSNTLAVAPRFGKLLEKGNAKSLSFLPLCHVYERTGLYYFMYWGVSVYYAESMETIADNLREVKPDTFHTVPRLLEKVYDKIISKGFELSTFGRKVFFWAVDLGLKYDPNKDFGWWYNFQLKMANKIVFSKWREALGGNVKMIGSGAAALQPRLARIFWAANIRVCEGYGLTETSPVISANAPTPEDVRIGTVGKILEGVDVKIAEDGEILCSGPNVMMGYFKQPDVTAEVMTGDWFHTGDIGVVEDGFLKITDRKKEMFKTSGGKYIAPQPMENKFKESIYIDQVMVLGEGQKFPSALIVPNFEAIKEWASKNHISEENMDALVKNDKIQDLIRREIDKYNQEFGSWEQIKKIELMSEPWGVDTGELTPTLKLKRRVLNEKFESLINKIYSFTSS